MSYSLQEMLRLRKELDPDAPDTIVLSKNDMLYLEAPVDERDNGCLCQRCGTRYKVDVNVSDELWAVIHGKENLLCGPCIVTALEQASDFDYYDLQHGSINEFKA